MSITEVLLVKQLRNWFTSRVQNVPSEVSACEFECHKPHCCQGEWEVCERRLATMNRERLQNSQ